MRNSISNTDDTLDSRDVIARIEALEEIKTELEERRDEANESESPAAMEATETELADWLDGGEGQELKALKALAGEAEGYAADWQYGEQLIRDSYFETFAEELADDYGLVPKDAAWPMTCIDWSEAARQLRQDYTSVDFDGITYWVRG